MRPTRIATTLAPIMPRIGILNGRVPTLVGSTLFCGGEGPEGDAVGKLEPTKRLLLVGPDVDEPGIVGATVGDMVGAPVGDMVGVSVGDMVGAPVGGIESAKWVGDCGE